jgi:anti-sigma-K factor RskA
MADRDNIDDIDHTDDTDGLEHVEAMLRSLTPDDLAPHAPPPAVWDAIKRTVSTDALQSRPLRLAPAAPARSASSSPATRRPFHSWQYLAAAAALVVVVAGAALVMSVRDNQDDRILATAALTYDAEQFDPRGAASAANVALVDHNGKQTIRIDDAALPKQLSEQDDLEIWLIEPDPSGNVAAIVSLGFVNPNDPGSFEVPAEIDTSQYSVVDISIEPRDGDATHSGHSILRGSLHSA